jgi:DNA topoisomerase-3
VGIDVAGEGFTATGLMVTQRNFLDVYRYQGWGGTDALPLFQRGQQFTPAAIELKQVPKRGAGGVHAPPWKRCL